jgi:hypothetical protein
MARRVFFSFHYQDVLDFRANVVRKHWVTKPDRSAAGFFDASIWEAAKKTGPIALKRLIHSGLENTSVTCVLAGSHTYARPWVRYELLRSFRKGSKLLTVHINSIKGRDGLTKVKGPNPLSYLAVRYSATGDTATLLEYADGKWTNYTEIDGSATYRTGGVDLKYRGKAFQLASLYSERDWVADDGYNNFAAWVG